MGSAVDALGLQRTGNVSPDAVGQPDHRAGTVAVSDGADMVKGADDADLAAGTERVRCYAGVIRVLTGPCVASQCHGLGKDEQQQ